MDDQKGRKRAPQQPKTIYSMIDRQPRAFVCLSFSIFPSANYQERERERETFSLFTLHIGTCFSSFLLFYDLILLLLLLLLLHSFFTTSPRRRSYRPKDPDGRSPPASPPHRPCPFSTNSLWRGRRPNSGPALDRNPVFYFGKNGQNRFNRKKKFSLSSSSSPGYTNKASIFIHSR